jgi:nucleotide-binding universal stress UspA family protein
MSALKTILVHADATTQSAVRLKLAEQLAAAHGAVATAIYAATSSLTRYPMALAAGAEIGPALVELDNQRREAARAHFAANVGASRMAWLEGAGMPVADVVQRAFYADLLLLGQRPPAAPDAPADIDVPADFVSSVILDSGRPALVLPHITRAPAPLQRVLIAWKATRESARAVSAALPLLQQAARVQVVAFDEGAGVQAEAGIVEYLRAHGVSAGFKREVALEHELGAQILSLAADEQAELLVMGCYGHGRAREWALGGVTRTVLQSMTLPVLLAH